MVAGMCFGSLDGRINSLSFAAGAARKYLGSLKTFVTDVHDCMMQYLLSKGAGTYLPLFRLKDLEISVIAHFHLTLFNLLAKQMEIYFQVRLINQHCGAIPLSLGRFPTGQAQVIRSAMSGIKLLALFIT